MIEMELNPDDKKVIDLLSKLKNTNGGYPSDILAARRQAYLKQVANVGLGIGVGAGIKNAAKNGNGVGAVATITSKILETTLIAAIAIEAGAVAYIYRDKIVDLIRTYTGSSNAQESGSSSTGLIEPKVSPSATVTTPSATAATPSVTVTTPSGTVTVTTGTPSPNVAGNNNSSSVNVTPKPGGNNGNQYGLTPKPERTKDNNNNNDKNNDGGSGNTDNGKPQKP
jgi:hypothetical protein